MNYFIITCLLIMLGFPKNVLASSDPEGPFKYSVVLKGEAFEAECGRSVGKLD